jgi:hypothetical protein
VECYPETYADVVALAAVPKVSRTYSAVPPKGRQSPVLVRDDSAFLAKIAEPPLLKLTLPNDDRR